MYLHQLEGEHMADAKTEDVLVAGAVRRAMWRLVPFLGLCYLLNYIDRTNVSFAQLTMNADLGLSAAAYGLGAGLFFVAYFFFEVPSNIILHKVGARVWIARIMITWGIIASGMAFVQNEAWFYVMRILLGIAEAGFFPGIILYLTYWFPRVTRAKMVALFFVAVPVSSVIGGPISTLLIANGDGAWGFDAGWRFMFFVEGIPSVLVGVLVLVLLADRPSKAAWLAPAEQQALEARIAAEDSAQVQHETGIRAGLADPRVLGLALVYFGIVFGSYVFQFFLPTVIKDMGKQFGTEYSIIQVGLITAIPYAVAALFMILNSRHSDRTGERRLHVAIPVFVGAAAVAVALFLGSPFLMIAAMSICAAGIWGSIPVFWTLPSVFLTGFGAAAGIALINSFGNLGGFAGPALIGALKDGTGTHTAGFFVVAAMLVMAGVAVMLVARRREVREGVTVSDS